jgi:hypothetical protein
MALLNRNSNTYQPSTGLSIPTTKRYELSNHLGNVLTTITGRRMGMGMSGQPATHFEPERIQASDYYAYGLEMPGRKYENSAFSRTNSYRYGFNGKELDKSGEWGSLTHFER